MRPSRHAVCDCGLGDLLRGGQACFRLQFWIGGDQETGGAGKDLRAGIVDARGEHLGRGQPNPDGISVHGNIVRLELAQIHAGDHFSVGHQKKLVAHQKVGQVGALAVALHDLIERINNRLQTRQLTNLLDDRS